MTTPKPNPGKALRKTITREQLGQWDHTRRKHGPIELLDHSNRGRVTSLLPLKRERMSASPFGFFRGAAAVMAYDLSLMPHTGITTQLCGDAHLQNLGAYEGIDGHLIFDINDFDETIRGPFEWDVKRMATSVLLAADASKLKPSAGVAAAQAFLSAYCALIRKLAPMPVLDVARFQVRRINATPCIKDVLSQAERSSPQRLLNKLTEPTRSGRVFRTEKPTLWRITGKDRHAVLASLKKYRDSLLPERRHFLDQFTPLDVGFKVVGTGSVGLRDYCIYLQGNGTGDPLFLQIKEEARSAYSAYLPKHDHPNVSQGERVADGQRAMQLQSDPMLGWTSFGGREYLVRQLNDHKASLDVSALDRQALTAYARLCGEILARGHARSGDVQLIAGYIGKGKSFSAAILTFATAYATQTHHDARLLHAAP